MPRSRTIWVVMLAMTTSGGFSRAGWAQDPDGTLDVIEERLATYAERLSHLDITYMSEEGASARALFELEGRLADGRVLYMLGDYNRAAVVLLDIVQQEAGQDSPGFSEARFYLAESLYQAGNLVAARGYYREIADDGNDPYRQDAIIRLLEVAFQTRHYGDLEELYQGLVATLGDQVPARIRYIRAKTLYFQDDVPAAAREFAGILPDSEEFPRASYFLGVCYVRLGQWDAALTAFQQALTAAGESSAQGSAEIADLASMAMGRVLFELGDWQNALLTYQSVSRTSPHYDRALYEMTWVYIKLERIRHALRTLEILSVAVPESEFLPQVQLIRGDLLIRLAQFDEATEIFDSTIARFGPLAEQLSQVVQDTGSPERYYAALIDPRLASITLPDLALQWVQHDETLRRALLMVQDLDEQQEQIQQSREIISELDAVLHSAGRVEIYSELESGYGQAIEIRYGLVSLLSQILSVQSELTLALVSSDQQATLRSLARTRQELDAALARLPVTYDLMVAEERTMDARIGDQQMAVFRLGYRLDTQALRLDAMRQQLREDLARGLRAQDEYDTIESALDEQAMRLEQLREERDRLRHELELSRLQTSVGTIAEQEPREIADQLQRTLDEESGILDRHRSVLRASQPAQLVRIDDVRSRIGQLQEDLRRFLRRIDSTVNERTAEITRQADTQRVLLDRYEDRLLAYRDQGERLSGQIAYESFIAVQQRFEDLILSADVGIVDVAWREKEERSQRIENLLDVRDSQLDVLDAEFRDVLETE